MDITVISRETIKPSSPTPPHLRHLKLSLIDQYHPATIYTSLILFYSPPQGDAYRFHDTNTSHLLKTSLAEVLTEFYPLAGSSADNQKVECNDNGLEYIEARVKAPLTLQKFLSCPKAEEFDLFVPSNFKKLSAVQVTMFDACGGMAIGVSLTHVLADGSSAACFINSWAAFARGAQDQLASPTFNFASLFPPRDIPLFTFDELEDLKVARKFITRSFVFPQRKIDTLKGNLSYERPTRVEAVSALILKCLINATDDKPRSSKSIYMTAAVNLRSRMCPPLPVHSIGNMILTIQNQIDPESSLEDLAVQFRNSIKKIDSDYVEKLQADNAAFLFETYEESVKIYMSNDVQFFTVGSWCKFPFYEADFGWGAPTWVAPVFPDAQYNVVMLDAKNGDGIEAWVTLDPNEMAQFESNDEFLEFACPISEADESQ